MNNYTCGTTTTADTVQHAKDKLNSIEEIVSIVTNNNEIICTPQYYWEPSFAGLIAFIALCLGIGLGLTAKKSKQ